MELSDAVDFARINHHSVLTTIRANGRPQLSNVLHDVSDDGVIRVSITADRAKYKNLVREPWAALHVTQPDFWAYAVLEGDVELTPVAAAPDDATVDELVEYYRAANGEHHGLGRVSRHDGAGPPRGRAVPPEPRLRHASPVRPNPPRSAQPATATSFAQR